MLWAGAALPSDRGIRARFERATPVWLDTGTTGWPSAVSATRIPSLVPWSAHGLSTAPPRPGPARPGPARKRRPSGVVGGVLG